MCIYIDIRTLIAILRSTVCSVSQEKHPGKLLQEPKIGFQPSPCIVPKILFEQSGKVFLNQEEHDASLKYLII